MNNTRTSQDPPATDIYVKQVSGAYVTNTLRGQRTSCTHSASEAAERQATKLFGARVQSVHEVKEGNTFTTRWRVTLKPAAQAEPAQ